jgi:hypothetical protein
MLRISDPGVASIIPSTPSRVGCDDPTYLAMAYRVLRPHLHIANRLRCPASDKINSNLRLLMRTTDGISHPGNRDISASLLRIRMIRPFLSQTQFAAQIKPR